MVHMTVSFSGEEIADELCDDMEDLSCALTQISLNANVSIKAISNQIVWKGEREQLADFCEKLAAKLREETEGE